MTRFRFTLYNSDTKAGSWTCTYGSLSDAIARGVAAARLFASRQVAEGYLGLKDRIEIYNEQEGTFHQVPFAAALHID